MAKRYTTEDHIFALRSVISNIIQCQSDIDPQFRNRLVRMLKLEQARQDSSGKKGAAALIKEIAGLVELDGLPGNDPGSNH